MNRFGFGAMRLPLINPDDKQSIDMDELKRMVDIYMEAGFTYFDTAFPYHDQMSETALKEALVDRYVGYNVSFGRYIILCINNFIVNTHHLVIKRIYGIGG